ncbi:MAG: DnaJ C-terminal domain-containing protein [Candidatus Sericytochromatia bacterium]
MNYKDYYKILGVDKKAAEKDIQKAYKTLAKKYHPDINKTKDAEAKFKEINEAYEVLGDKDKRQKYDNLGANWNQYQNFGNYSYQDMGDIKGNKFYGSDFSDFFEIFFGSGAGGGSTPNSSNPFGNIFSNMGFGGQQNTQQKKKTNQQTNQNQAPKEKLEAKELDIEVSINEINEGGKRLIDIGSKKIEVNIPKGIDEGSKIRIKGENNNNDIHLKVKIKAHDTFKLDGKNIIYEAPINDYDAVFGTEIRVPTISGSSVNLKIPATTQGGKQLRLKNLGLPNRKTDEKGDMFVKIKIMIPTNLTDKEKELYKQLKELRS